MQFLKKLKAHYEKLILGLVLAVLLGASIFLLFQVSGTQEYLKNQDIAIGKQAAKALKPVDLTTNEVVLKRLSAKQDWQLSGEHNLLNPVQWQRKPDGTLIKIQTGNEVGPMALQVQKIIPLNLIVAFEAVSGSGDAIRYQFAVTREADKNPSHRRRVPSFVTPGGKTSAFMLKEIKGSKEEPDGFLIELLEGNKEVLLTKDKPFTQVGGYMADLRYEPENRSFLGRRVDDKITFGGESYNIVAITEREVVLSALSTTKRTTVKYSAAP